MCEKGLSKPGHLLSKDVQHLLDFVLWCDADKLKELGNSVLGNFGLSLDNFKATKDPQTGSYSINFQQ